MEKLNRKKLLADLVTDTLGCAVYALGLHVFTVPNHIAPGGLSGLGTIVNYFTGIPIGTFVLALNIPILLVALKYLGRYFVLNTFKTVLISTLMLDFILLPVPVYVGDPLLAAAFGGICIGAGLGIVFSSGATTGGTDVIMRLLRLKFPNMSMGSLMMAIDFLVIVASVVAFGNLEVGLYGVIAVYCSSICIDKVLTHGEKGKLTYIFSDRHEEIAGRVMAEIGRGVTYLQGEGAYSRQERKVLFCAVSNSEFVRLKQMVTAIDPKALLIVSNSEKVYGEGFLSYDEV